MSETDIFFEVIRNRQTEAPVDVLAIARDLGLDVYADENLPDSVSGLLTKDDDGFFIVVNEGHHVHRQRFTIEGARKRISAVISLTSFTLKPVRSGINNRSPSFAISGSSRAVSFAGAA